jgi:hypothetical protein
MASFVHSTPSIAHSTGSEARKQHANKKPPCKVTVDDDSYECAFELFRFVLAAIIVTRIIFETVFIELLSLKMFMYFYFCPLNSVTFFSDSANNYLFILCFHKPIDFTVNEKVKQK